MSQTASDTLASKNTLALTALIMGLLALLTSLVVIGGLLGVIALVLGIMAITRPGRKGMSIAGITTGSLAIPAAGFAAFLWILLPALTVARTTAKTTVAATNVKALLSGCAIYAASWADDCPEHLAVLVTDWPLPGTGDPVRLLRDPRLSLPPMVAPPRGTPWKSIQADVDAHCDFFYTPAKKFITTPRPSEFILLYDKGTAGTTRIVGFADGHVETFPPSDAARLTAIVEACNRTRASLRLSPLPLDLKSAPPPPPAPALAPGKAPVP